MGLFIFIAAVFIVKQQTAAIVEALWKISKVLNNLVYNLKFLFLIELQGRLSLKIQQLDVIVETKTLDDVFVRLKVSVQFKVIKDKVYEAFYKLDYPHDQITSYVFDVVKS